jgi:hypothetical protein
MALIDDGYAALSDLRRGLEDGDEVGCHLFLNVKPTRQNKQSWYRIRLDPALAVSLAQAAQNSISMIEVRAVADNALTEFDFDAMVDGHVGVLNVRDTPEIAEWLNATPLPDHPAVFDGTEEVLGRARFYAFRLVLPDGRSVTAFRSKGGFEVAARKRNAVTAIFHRDTHELVPVAGAVVTFDQVVDFMEWDGLLFVANMRTFEAVTDMRQITVRKAVEAVDALAARFDLGDIDALKTQVEKRTRLGKRLASAHKHGLAADLDPDQVAMVIDRRRLRFRCERDGADVRFHIDHADPRSIEDFVDLVSDVFLESPTTRREWEALAKRPARAR